MLNSLFGFSLILRLSDTSGHNCHAIVLGQILVGPIDLGIVAVRFLYTTSQIISDHNLRNSPKELEGAGMGHYPIFQLLCPCSLRIGVIGTS